MKEQRPARTGKRKSWIGKSGIRPWRRWTLFLVLPLLCLAVAVSSSVIKTADASRNARNQGRQLAAHGVRKALDDAALAYDANPTDDNARRLNSARAAFQKLPKEIQAAGVNSRTPMGPSAMVQVKALKEFKRGLTATQRKISS